MKTKSKDIGDMARGVKLKEKTESKELQASEFYEEKAVVKTDK